jgi:TetR/AcrR family transcriptional repressor of lmrAB and yxaGH operons
MSNSRDQIIEKTCELLELQGYHATGLNQIIKESGSPKGSLYHYFPGGKEELAVEAVSRVGEIVLKHIRHNLAQVDPPAEAVRVFTHNIALNVERSGFQTGGPITTIAMEMAASSDALRETCDGIYTGWREAFADKFRSGGLVEERASRIAMLTIAGIEGGVILCRTSRSRTPLEHVGDELALLIGSAG